MNSLTSEILVAIIGAVATVGSAIIAGVFALVKRKNEKKEQTMFDEDDTQPRFRIDDDHDKTPENLIPNGTFYLRRFKIKGFIGRGGFSHAYIAWDQSHDREVVIKLLPKKSKQPFYLNHFLKREEKIAQKLTGVDIYGLVKTLEVIPGEEDLCIVQENIPGQSLYNRLEYKGILDSSEALTTIISISKTVEKLHNLNIIHCDIKPLNIIIRAPSDPVLIDLGASRFIGEHIDKNAIVLSAPYSPPELLTGEPIDGRVDIFSLGMTLLHLLSKRTDFEKFMDTMGNPLDSTEWYPSPYEISEHIDRQLLEIKNKEIIKLISTAVAFRPDNRYISIKHFYQAAEKIKEKLS